MLKIPTSFSNTKYCSVLFSFLVFPLIMSGCSPVTEETTSTETYTIPETESYIETIPFDPKPEGYLAGNDTITVYQQEGDWPGDFRVRVERQGEEPLEIRLSSDNGCTAEILDENTILFTIYEGSGWYQMRYDLSSGNSQHTRKETGYLLQKIGLTPEETVSMRYMSYWLEGEVCTEAEVITQKEYYHWREYRGERSLEKTSLVQTDRPTEAEIRTHFQTMVDFVEYENALPSNTMHNPLEGDDRYYRNEYRAVNTPAALEYVFSCFLTQADTEDLMQWKNADGEIWWKQDTRGYLYVSPVSFGLAEYRDQPMDIVRETDGNYRVTVSGREFLYVLESGCWRWKLTPQENEQTELPTEPVKSIVPQEAEEQAALLTEQIVMHVMSMDWMQQPGYQYTDWDLHWFIETLPKYRNTLVYPYYEWMEIQDDTWFLFPKKAAEQAIYELFGIENYTLPTEDDLYDAETDSYKRNLGSGTHTTMFWYEGMQITSEEDFVYVDCDLVSSREFEWEEMFYGRYRFTYRCCTDGERTFLRLEGYERILKTLQNTQDFPEGNELYQNIKPGMDRRLPAYAKTVQNFKDIYKYMNLLIDYFNTPYEIGDPLDSHNVLYLCAALCACCEEGEPAFVSFSVSEDYIMTISKAELDVLAGHLFGESVDLTKYHNTFSGKFDTFNTVSEVYTFSTATDYWQGDGYYYLRDDMVVQENEKFLSFEMTIQNTGYLVDSSVQPVQKRMRYLFEKKVFDGLVYPQLIKIAECP